MVVVAHSASSRVCHDVNTPLGERSRINSSGRSSKVILIGFLFFIVFICQMFLLGRSIKKFCFCAFNNNHQSILYHLEMTLMRLPYSFAFAVLIIPIVYRNLKDNSRFSFSYFFAKTDTKQTNMNLNESFPSKETKILCSFIKMELSKGIDYQIATFKTKEHKSGYFIDTNRCIAFHFCFSHLKPKMSSCIFLLNQLTGLALFKVKSGVIYKSQPVVLGGSLNSRYP